MTSAARVLDAATWTQTQVGLVARRPSWLAPAANAAAPISTRSTTPSVAPRARLTSIPPPSRAAGSTAEAEIVGLQAEIQRRDEELTIALAELESLRHTTAELASAVATTRRRVLEASESELVKLALEIATRVVGHGLEADPSLIVSWAREAVATMPARDGLVVVISPDVAARVPEADWALATGGAHRLEVDPQLPPGSCELRSGAGVIEVGAVARLAAVGEAIGAIS